MDDTKGEKRTQVHHSELVVKNLF